MDAPTEKFVASRPSTADSSAMRGCGLANLTWVGVDKVELRQRLMMPEYLRLAMRDCIKRKDSTAIPDHLLLPGGAVADMAPHAPMVVFINPKSGGRHGPVLKERLQQLMSEEQVFDLTEVKPHEFVRYGLACLEKVAAEGDECAKECRARLRIMVAGGDGTVGWVLGCLGELNKDGKFPIPPVGVIPLGTGNDLSRSFGWGGSFPFAWRSAVKRTLHRASMGPVARLDSWKILVSMPSGEVVDPPYSLKPAEENELDQGLETGIDAPPLAKTYEGVFYNYLSIGMDAQVAYGFHHLRNTKPYLAQGPISNKIIYSGFGCTQGWFCTPCVNDPGLRGLRNILKIHIKKVNCSQWEEIAVPTFLPSDLLNKYYHGFCKHYLWPIFHYVLPMTQAHGSLFDRSNWKAYTKVNKIFADKIFADKIFEVLNPDEDYVWIHDYHLMILPTFLRNRFHRIKLGIFLHSPFPSSEIYRTLPVREEILKGFLNCDLIGFHTFDYARHFLSCCSRMLGLDYESKRGYIGLEYFGRTVSIKILPVGIHMGQIESIKASEETSEKVKGLRERFSGNIVMLGVDDLDMFKGISLKFWAMGQLLEQNEALRGKVVLVQITNPARSSGKDVQDVEKQIHLIADEINDKFGTPGYKPIVFMNEPVSTLDKVAYYAVSECVVVNAVRDGMNLVPYKYTVTRQGSPALDAALGFGPDDVRKSVIIVSEFIGCSPSLSGAIRVNPWNIDAVTDAMSSAITMSNKEKNLRHQKHHKYISSHDVVYWSRSYDQDLQRACKDHNNKRFWGVGFGLGFRVVALDPNFRKLGVETIVPAYRRTSSRLILLDYDGTMMDQDILDKRPSDDLISLLNRLCDDPNNLVFIVSGRGKDPLSKWFGSCANLGLSAEHGYFTRWNCNSQWETSVLPVDLSWKKIVKPVMNHYIEATDGSFIEEKASAMVWHHQEADPSFGSWQAKELLDHLESVLTNEPVVVKRGQHIVEVKPQDVSKGKVVEHFIATMRNNKGKRPDFLLCIGDDRSDEDMFDSIVKHQDVSPIPFAEVFACTVGQKPSKAKYYLDDTPKVINMLEWLASASDRSKDGGEQSKFTFQQGQCRNEIIDL